MTNKYLIVVDMQNDFVTGSLGTKEAQNIVQYVVQKINHFKGSVIFTKDTHEENYLSTYEGKMLPVRHCISDTPGWQLIEELKKIQMEKDWPVYLKPVFGSVKLAQDLQAIHKSNPISEIELIGVCTDICVVSNALLLKAYLPEVPIWVDASCCAGTTSQKHIAALETMKSCQIMIRKEAAFHDAV